MLNGKKIKTIVQMLGVVIFIYILFQIDYRLFFDEVKLLKWQLLIVAIALMVFEIVVRSLRWRRVLSALGIGITRASSISLQWLGIFLGVVTPGRVGELIKIYFLKHRGYSAFRSFFSIVFDRIIDILILLFIGVLVFFFFLPEIGIYLLFFAVALLVPIIFLFLLVDQKSYLHKIFGKLIKKIFPFDFSDYNYFTFDKFWRGIRGLKKRDIIYFLIYLVLSWLLYFYARYYISLSMGLDLTFVDIMVVSVSVAIVSILPISIAGLGTREITVIYLFSLFGLGKETALLFSLLIFTTDIFVVSFGLIPYLKESFLIKEVRQNKSIDKTHLI